MNTDNTRGTDSRSLSLGAVLKEQRGLRAGVPDVEYEYGSGDSGGNDSGEEDAKDSKKRVVMMYDEDGNATPMPMARFYYDSVQRQSAGNEDEDEDEESPTTDGRTAASNVSHDTTRSNVPAPFVGKGTSSSASSSTPSSEKEDVDINNKDGRNFVADDSDYDEFDDEEEGEEAPNDRFQNQFMRISVAATGLKDVKRVKKDLDHDKPNKKSGLRAGIQRAVSTVKIGEGSRPRKTPSSSKSRPSQPLVTAKQLKKTESDLKKSTSGLSRIASITRGKSDKSSQASVDDAKQEHSADAFQDCLVSPGLQRERESTAKPVRRQGLAAVGRMISISKQKGTTAAQQPVSSNLGDLPAPVPDRASPSETTDRSRRSGTLPTGSSKPSGRASIAQVGRLLSFSKKKAPSTAESKPTNEDDSRNSSRGADRDRRETEVGKPSAARMGLAKLGRVMSLNRSKTVVDSKDEGLVGRASPLSTSTVSTGADSSSGDATSSGRDRSRSSISGKKEPSRMKVATRMLSFSRKPGQSSRQGRVLMAADETKREKGDKRSKSVPVAGPQGGTPAQKLDGRGDKFFFSEINSEKVRQCGLLSEAHIRVPVIAMAEYSGPVSRTKWYIDGFTLPHNAVRRECIDLYEILMAMAHCKGTTDICKDDMDDFEDWWKVASGFFSCYFDMERRVLFPWVDSAGSQDWEVQTALRKMRSMKDKLQEQLQRVDRLWNEKTFKEVGEMFALIYKAVDELVPRLMNYFADQEVLLPAIVKGYYRLDDRLKMDKDMVSVFIGDSAQKDKDNEHHNLVLLIRWIGNPRQLRAWIGKNLPSSARSMYPKWYALYEEDHLRIVKQAKSRAKVSGNMP